MSLLVTANVNTYQIKWYPDSLFNLFVVNLKTYFPHPPTPFATVLQTRYCLYCVHVLVYSLNTASVFFFTSSLTYQRKNSRWLAVMARNINDRRVIMYSLFVQLKTKSAMMKYQRPNDKNGLMNTIAPLWRFGDCDVTTSVMS